MDEPVRLPCAAGEALVFSTRAPFKEGVNEDSAALIAVGEGRSVLAVADGVGSTRSAAEASQVAVRELRRALGDAAAEPELRGRILDGIERANQSVLELGNAATTLAVVEIQPGILRPYHVGDSEVLVVGQRGKLKHGTISHSPVGYAVEAGLLEETEAMHHEDRHLISNAVGTPDMRIEVGPSLPLAPRDTLLLGSDGLFDNLHREEIVQMIRHGPLGEIGHVLVATCLQRMLEGDAQHPGKPDDLTFILFRPTPVRTRRGSPAPKEGV
jgi:serine/threonine protein phosphatase PrpC